MHSEGSREMPEQRAVLFEHLFRIHGILRLRAAPPSPARRSAQDDLDFDGSSRAKNHARVLRSAQDDRDFDSIALLLWGDVAR